MCDYVSSAGFFVYCGCLGARLDRTNLDAQEMQGLKNRQLEADGQGHNGRMVQ